MLTQLECFPCFLRQTIIALGQGPYVQDTRIGREILNDVLAIMQKADTGKPPAYTTTFVHRTIRERLGLDPFKEIKREYNALAMGLYHTLKSKVKSSKDPLWTAARLAIAGNVIDFGIFTSIDIDGSVRKALGPSIAVDDYPAFRESVREAEEILYLLDNAGEIVFDRLLIEQLVSSGKKVRAVVKGSPVLNDVTHEDAVQTGLTKLCSVIDNGSDAIGTILGCTSPEFQSAFHDADLVISKGQGNFETLSENERSAFFLFQAKCEVVSKELGLPPSSMLLKKS